MAKLLHIMGTEAACAAALTFLRTDANGDHVGYTATKTLSDSERDYDVEEYVITVAYMPGVALKVMYAVTQVFWAFCWELTSNGHRESEMTDGNFNPRENMETILLGRLRHEEPPATLLLRYEIALEKARAIRYEQPALYTSLAIAVGILAQLNDRQLSPHHAKYAATRHINARWDGGTEEYYTARRIIFSALAASIGDIIEGQTR